MIDAQGGVPVYRQLANLLRAQIEAGELAPGDRLPAETALAEQHAVSRDTVRDAIRELREAGLVTTRRGSGAYVRERAVRLAPEVEVTARAPTLEERERWHLGDGVPVLVVTVNGEASVYPADRTRLTL